MASTLAAWSFRMTRSAPVSIDRAMVSASPFPNRRPSALTKHSFFPFDFIKRHLFLRNIQSMPYYVFINISNEIMKSKVHSLNFK